MQISGFKSRLTLIVGYIHLVYLGLLPAVATFGILYTYGYPVPFLLFLGGTVAVSVYVAAVFYYTSLPASLGWSLLILLDGPLWMLLSLWSKRSTPLGYAVEGFLVDGTAIWLSILILALRLFRQRLAAVGFMLIALITTVSLVYPYFRDDLWGQWISLIWLGAGILEAVGIRLRQLKQDEEQPLRPAPDQSLKNADKTAIFIVVLVLVWIFAMILGNVLFELRTKPH